MVGLVLLLTCTISVFCPRTAQDLHDSIVPFVASELVHRILGLLHDQLSSPRACPIARIVDGVSVEEGAVIDPSEPLDHFLKR